MTKISAKQESVIASLLSANSIREACELTGVSERSVYNWLQQPEFIKSYKQARRCMFDQAVSQLQQLARISALELQAIITNQENSAAARVSAIKVVLENSRAGILLDDLAERLEVIEKKLEHRP